MVPVRITVPDPACVKDPVPLITFDTVKVPVSLNISALLLVILPEPKVPVVPPLPICNVPAVIVVTPECVFVPVRITVALWLEPPFIVRVLPPDNAPLSMIVDAATPPTDVAVPKLTAPA